MGLDKYGPEAIGQEEYERVQEELENEVGQGGSVYGPEAIAGGHSEDEIRAAAERAGVDPEPFLEAQEEAAEPEFVALWSLPFEDQATADLAEQELPGPEALDDIEPTGGTEQRPVYRGVDVSDAIAALGSDEEPSEGDGEGEPDRNMIELAGDTYEFPPGYHAEHAGGGKYRVEDESGEQVENPESDKGLYDREQTAEAAWEDFELRAEEQAQEEEEPEEGGDLGTKQVSVAELREILENEPELLDERQAAEMMRPGGPRQDALKVLLEHAVAQERSEIVQVVAGEIDDEDFVAETLAE